MDIALIQTNDGRFDIAIEGNDVKADNGLRSAIIVSLFSDRQAEPDDEISDGTNNRRGYWADQYTGPDGARLGSRLWLLSRSKQTQQVLDRARDYCLEALQWMLNDGVASAIDAQTEWLDRKTLGITVQIFKADGQPYDDVFEYSLESF